MLRIMSVRRKISRCTERGMIRCLGKFLYEPIQYLVVRGDHEEQFLDYGFCKENSKILYSYHKRIIPSFFTGTFFNRHNISYQRCALSSKSLNAYFFLHSTTDRSEDTNRYLESVNLSPIDMKTFF